MIYIDEQKQDNTWNNDKCPKEIAKMLLKGLFNFPAQFFDTSGDKCFCVLCHSARNDRMVYSRGKPSKRYVLPVEWVRFGLKREEGKWIMNNVSNEWHVAFHGTSRQDVYEIFKSGLILLKPGDYKMNGDQLKMRSQHIKKSFNRYNKYTKQNEIFDPNQIFVSPSIRSGIYIYSCMRRI